MKAIVFERYGPPEVLQVKDVDTPAPRDNEVRIAVHATSVTAAEGMMRRGDTFMSRIILGLRRPKKKYRVLGIELSGEVESIGRNVKRFRKGDQVFGFTGFKLGGYAEFACLPESSSLALKPANLSYEEAASVVDGATTAFFFLKQLGDIRKGHRVLIIGASGSIGVYAVQLARHFEADVTGVCSAANAEMVKALGAQKVIDYAALFFLKELIEAGQLRPVIDRRYPMDQIVEAHRHVETGHKKGNVVITVGRDGTPASQ